jgi:HSP20 family molecular chaperone IbpA
MASIIKLRPFATRSLSSYAPRIMSALSSDPDLWFNEPFFSNNSLWNQPTTSLSTDFHRPVRVVENDHVWKLSCDLPGIKAKDVSVTSDGTNIQISAARHYVVGKNDSKTIKKSRFIQTFPIHSQMVDVSQIKANLSDGVLIVTAPKKTEESQHKIAITTEPHKTEDLAIEGADDLDEDDDVDDDLLEDVAEAVASIDVKDTSSNTKSSSKK